MYISQPQPAALLELSGSHEIGMLSRGHTKGCGWVQCFWSLLLRGCWTLFPNWSPGILGKQLHPSIFDIKIMHSTFVLKSWDLFFKTQYAIKPLFLQWPKVREFLCDQKHDLYFWLFVKHDFDTFVHTIIIPFWKLFSWNNQRDFSSWEQHSSSQWWSNL